MKTELFVHAPTSEVCVSRTASVKVRCVACEGGSALVCINVSSQLFIQCVSSQLFLQCLIAVHDHSTLTAHSLHTFSSMQSPATTSGPSAFRFLPLPSCAP